MSNVLEPGVTGRAEVTAGPGNLASDLGSGFVSVFSTPTMIALMETAAGKSVESLVGEGKTTVGVRVDIRHLRPLQHLYPPPASPVANRLARPGRLPVRRQSP